MRLRKILPGLYIPRVFLGVCAAIANRLHWNIAIVRILMIILFEVTQNQAICCFTFSIFGSVFHISIVLLLYIVGSFAVSCGWFDHKSVNDSRY